jgi:type IV pilus assembly protein PilX
MHRSLDRGYRSQRGTVLFVALILLLVLTLAGVTAARMQTAEEQMAQNDDNHQIALQNGEAVLRNNEATFEDGMYTDVMFTGGTQGLLTLSTEVTSAASNYQSLADQPVATINAQSITYTGPPLASAPTAPQYIVEDMPPVTVIGSQMCSSKYGATNNCMMVRTTTIATGGDANATVTLQSVAN